MAGDANYANVSLLLHCDGAGGSTTITDNSPTPKVVTAVGGAQISTTQSKFGGSSIYFDGSGDYLSSTITDAIGTGDFTIEGWIYLASTAADCEICCIGNIAAVGQFDLVFEHSAGGRLRGSIQNGSGGVQLDISTAAGLLSVTTWHHVAFAVSGTSGKLFIDGVERQSGTVSGTRVQARTDFRVGHLVTTTYQRWLNGYLDDLRVTKGVARYTSAFTPPAAPFVAGLGQVSGVIRDSANALCARTVRAYRRDTGVLVGDAYTQAGDSSIANVKLLLHLDGLNAATTTTDKSSSARAVTFVGNAAISTTRSKFGISSLALDGTGDYLTVPWSTDFSITATDFNIAMWVYRAASGVSHYLMSGRPAAATDGWEWRINATNFLQFFYTGGSSVTGAVAVPSGQWSLVEVDRSGTSLKMWIDGVAAGSGTVANGTTSTTPTLKIGCDNVGTTGFNGWIDEVRFTKSLSRNQAAYTPPTDRYPDNNLALGYYSITVPTTDEVNVIAYDNSVSGTFYNDQVARVIPA